MLTMNEFFLKLEDVTSSITIWYSYASNEGCNIGMSKDGKDIIIDDCSILISGKPFFKNKEIHKPIISVNEMNELLNKHIEVVINGQFIIGSTIISAHLGRYKVLNKDIVRQTVMLERINI